MAIIDMEGKPLGAPDPKKTPAHLSQHGLQLIRASIAGLGELIDQHTRRINDLEADNKLLAKQKETIYKRLKNLENGNFKTR